MAEYRVAPVVEQMVRYLPFDAEAGNLFEEHVSIQDAPASYETRTFSFVLKLLSGPASLIVLTGDAGHGKTHLCRRILERTGLSPSRAVEQLNSDPEGSLPVHLPESDKPVRVVKDLSEFTEDAAVRILQAILADPECIGIVCANEGRLRSVASRDPGNLGIVLDTLEEGIRHGQTTIDGTVHVLNLNFQSVAPAGNGFLVHLLDSWARDGRRWTNCSQCAAVDHCPIYRNKEYLGERGANAERRRDGLLQLVRTAEQTGYVLTIREALILSAYLLTGGASCPTIHDLHKRRALKQLREYDLTRLLFERPLSDGEARQLGALERMRRYDPGLVPHRDVDEKAVRTLEDENELGSEAWFGTGALAQSRRQRREESRSFRELVRIKRRESYFEDPKPGIGGVVDRARRMGLYHYREFDHIQGGDENAKSMREILERLIHGLHVIQGIRPRDRSHFYLVDPAFSRSGSHTSVIALRILKRELWLFGLHEYWHERDPHHPADLMEAVDWLDRSVSLCRGKEQPDALLSLDLLQFEFVLRAAEGVSFSKFHAADRRRILARLATIAEQGGSVDEEIRFVMEDAVKRIIIERDGTIEVHGGE